MQIEKVIPINGISGYSISESGVIVGRRGKPIKIHKNKKGYLQFSMPDSTTGKTFSKAIHRLVAECFIDGDRSMQVNHKDGNKLNNHVSNLEYLSCKDNIRHAIRIGLRQSNINLVDNRMFDPLQVSVIKKCIADGMGNQELSKYFKCNHSTISKIRKGINYKSVAR